MQTEGVKIDGQTNGESSKRGAALSSRCASSPSGFVMPPVLLSGQVTFRNGEYLGVHPGKLIRGPQTAPTAMAAE